MLAATLWPDVERESARNSLRTALANLRSRLPDGWIESNSDSVKLPSGLLSCDAVGDTATDPYLGEFMPGFDLDWVVETRLRLQAEACGRMISRAERSWLEGRHQAALALISQACEIDPLEESAVKVKLKFLEESQKSSEAARLAATFRAKVLRELGHVSDIGLRPARLAEPTQQHPLSVAAEWLLERDPDGALEMLAATHTEWLSMPVDPASELHSRVLSLATKDSPSRKLVEAQAIFLLVLAGKLGDKFDQAIHAYREASRAGHHLIAARLAGALAYGCLSRGEFTRSSAFARRSLELARLTANPQVEAEFEMLVGIIECQLGHREQGWAALEGVGPKVEGHGTPQMVYGHQLLLIQPAILKGQIDQAVEHHQAAKSFYVKEGVCRTQCWVDFSEAEICFAVGNDLKAKEIVEGILNQGAAFAGHSVIALCYDMLACVNCRLGELDTAAATFARAAIFRKSLGTVPSVFERAMVKPSKLLLKEKLGVPFIRSAYRAMGSAEVGLRV